MAEETFDCRMWAVDPGTEHVGWAVFQRYLTQPSDNLSGWRCVRVGTTTPESFLTQFANAMLRAEPDIVVYERFIVEPERAPKLAGDELEVVQMIGALKWIFNTCQSNNAWPGWHSELIGQTNKIKKPTAGVLKNRGIKSLARRTKQPGDHAFDAELHGYHHIIHTLDQPVLPPRLVPHEEEL